MDEPTSSEALAKANGGYKEGWTSGPNPDSASASGDTGAPDLSKPMQVAVETAKSNPGSALEQMAAGPKQPSQETLSHITTLTKARSEVHLSGEASEGISEAVPISHRGAAAEKALLAIKNPLVVIPGINKAVYNIMRFISSLTKVKGPYEMAYEKLLDINARRELTDYRKDQEKVAAQRKEARAEAAQLAAGTPAVSDASTSDTVAEQRAAADEALKYNPYKKTMMTPVAQASADATSGAQVPLAVPVPA